MGKVKTRRSGYSSSSSAGPELNITILGRVDTTLQKLEFGFASWMSSLRMPLAHKIKPFNDTFNNFAYTAKLFFLVAGFRLLKIRWIIHWPLCVMSWWKYTLIRIVKTRPQILVWMPFLHVSAKYTLDTLAEKIMSSYFLHRWNNHNPHYITNMFTKDFKTAHILKCEDFWQLPQLQSFMYKFKMAHWTVTTNI